MQLRVLRLGLLQDGDVGIDVFPEVQAALRGEADAAQVLIEARVVGQGVRMGLPFSSHLKASTWRQPAATAP